MSSAENNNNNQQPGLLGAHAQYVKGVAEETIGNVTGSEEWKASGAQDKGASVDVMKALGEQRDSSKQGYGGLEEQAGHLMGCDGMKKEGAESKAQQ